MSYKKTFDILSSEIDREAKKNGEVTAAIMAATKVKKERDVLHEENLEGVKKFFKNFFGLPLPEKPNVTLRAETAEAIVSVTTGVALVCENNNDKDEDWLRRLHKRHPDWVKVVDAPTYSLNRKRIKELGVTERELEKWGLSHQPTLTLKVEAKSSEE